MTESQESVVERALRLSLSLDEDEYRRVSERIAQELALTQTRNEFVSFIGPCPHKVLRLVELNGQDMARLLRVAYFALGGNRHCQCYSCTNYPGGGMSRKTRIEKLREELDKVKKDTEAAVTIERAADKLGIPRVVAGVAATLGGLRGAGSFILAGVMHQMTQESLAKSADSQESLSVECVPCGAMKKVTITAHIEDPLTGQRSPITDDELGACQACGAERWRYVR